MKYFQYTLWCKLDDDYASPTLSRHLMHNTTITHGKYFVAYTRGDRLPVIRNSFWELAKCSGKIPTVRKSDAFPTPGVIWFTQQVE